jgi:hypothetical protein
VTAFVGEVHPLAEVWPLLEGEELAALAESIAEHGLREPIVIDGSGRLLDGRNRLAACRLAKVAPMYVTLPDLDTEERIAAYIGDRNAERRHLSAGQQAMGRALMLQAAGKRKNGRWERGAITQSLGLSQDEAQGETEALRKAGLVLDTAARAVALGEDFADYTLLPAKVMAREDTLDFAYRMSVDFEGRAVLAEAMKTQPLTEAVLKTSVILDDVEALLPWPVLAGPMTKDHRKRIEELNRRARTLAAQFSTYAKENQ